MRSPKWADRRPAEKRLYGTAAWKKLRAAFLAANPVCQIRLACAGAVANEVDHRVPVRFAPARALDWTNLQAACKACNLAKERQDKGKFKFEGEK
jgi:5-methylcytosine-specific restriction endonuclease McrA